MKKIDVVIKSLLKSHGKFIRFHCFNKFSTWRNSREMPIKIKSESLDKGNYVTNNFLYQQKICTLTYKQNMLLLFTKIKNLKKSLKVVFNITIVQQFILYLIIYKLFQYYNLWFELWITFNWNDLLSQFHLAYLPLNV